MTADESVDALLRTTQAVTVIRSGEVSNVIPGEARAVVNIRLLPGDVSTGVLARVERVARKAIPSGFSLHVDFRPRATLSEPVPEARIDPALWKAVEDSVLLVEPRAVIAPFLVVGTTDSRLFARLTEAIVRFTPVMMTAQDLAGIHGVDERISLENYGRMIAYYINVGSSGIHVAAKAEFFKLLGMRFSPPRWNRMAIRKRFRLRNPHAIFFTH